MPATTSTSPAEMASAEVMATASWGLSREMSATREPDTIATVEAGPTISCGEDPSTAYASRASGTAYNPTCTGTPAMVA